MKQNKPVNISKVLSWKTVKMFYLIINIVFIDTSIIIKELEPYKDYVFEVTPVIDDTTEALTSKYKFNTGDNILNIY